MKKRYSSVDLAPEDKGEKMKDQKYFLKKAVENMPKLYSKEMRPEPFSVEVDHGTSVLLDLGEHCVGNFSFSFDIIDDFISAPVKFTVRFGEDMREINDDFSAYKGRLGSSWLQEEVLIVDYPGRVEMQRRYSCRYIKITVSVTRRPLRLSDFCFKAYTSADMNKLAPSCSADPLLNKIDTVGALTLKECMQTFLEDGPKRDRRLWIGDLRLEALTNYYTFNNSEVVKRSLYLIAAGERNSLGFLPSYIYETPYFFSGRDNIADYALLFVVAVCDYYEHTKDKETLLDFLELSKSQLDSLEKILDERLIVTPQGGWFTFIDWCEGLRALTSLQGVYLYTLDRFSAILGEIGDADAEKYKSLLSKGREAAMRHLYDSEAGLFRNELDGGQISVHSQVWMILGGVITGEDAKRSLTLALEDETALHPFTPYMWHYVLEAMWKIGMQDEAIGCIKRFWGGMLERGADTFHEVYVPNDPDFSPYFDRMINSLCHAWSCSPSYFIRKYKL